MTHHDLAELSRLWQGDEPVGQDSTLDIKLNAVERRTRFYARVEYGASALLILAIAVTVLMEREATTLAIGFVIGVVTLWSTWRRQLSETNHLLHVDAGATYVEEALRFARQRLRRSRVGLVLLWPGILLGLLLDYSIDHRGQLSGIGERLLDQMLSGEGPTRPLLFAGCVIFAWFAREHGSIRREVRRLRSIAADYQADEADSSAR